MTFKQEYKAFSLFENLRSNVFLFCSEHLSSIVPEPKVPSVSNKSKNVSGKPVIWNFIRDASFKCTSSFLKTAILVDIFIAKDPSLCFLLSHTISVFATRIFCPKNSWAQSENFEGLCHQEIKSSHLQPSSLPYFELCQVCVPNHAFVCFQQSPSWFDFLFKTRGPNVYV